MSCSLCSQLIHLPNNEIELLASLATHLFAKQRDKIAYVTNQTFTYMAPLLTVAASGFLDATRVYNIYAHEYVDHLTTDGTKSCILQIKLLDRWRHFKLELPQGSNMLPE